jgi:MYXO-CTERM domain-containing protein
MLRALLASLALVTGVLTPRLAAPGDTGDTAGVTETGDPSGGGTDTTDSGPPETGGADTVLDTADTAADPGFGAVDLSGEPGGCGCASTPAPHATLAALVAVTALAIGRRRA